MTGRRGVTLAELILVAWLFALVLLALGRFAAAQSRLGAAAQDRVRAADFFRTLGLVLEGELRYAAPVDLAGARDSIRLRAIRGSGPICTVAGPEITVRYRGVRVPDPAKDSVLLVTASGTLGTAHGIISAAADTACGGYRLTLDAPAGPGMALLFETGTYHLSGGAFRYRRGRGGRQPVTEALLDSGSLGFGRHRLVAALHLHGDSLPRLAVAADVIAIALLNGTGVP